MTGIRLYDEMPVMTPDEPLSVEQHVHRVMPEIARTVLYFCDQSDAEAPIVELGLLADGRPAIFSFKI